MNKPEEAYKWALEALKYVQQTDNSNYKKDLVATSLTKVFSQFDPSEVDLCQECAPDAADLPLALKVALVFKKHGEGQYAREIVLREYAKDPGDPRLKAEIENFQEEDARNRAQKEKWNYSQKYVRNPFSRFNFDMAVAFLVQEKRLPKVFRDLGERRLDAALEISPDSRDAWLLKGWYLYNQDDAENAVTAVRKVLKEDPENSNAWLALGFFLAKAGDSYGAASAFEKVTELYPGYSRRAVVEDIRRKLTQGKSIESASNRE